MTRQQKRRATFKARFTEICQQYGGGPNWQGKDNLPRRNRRKIARKLAKV